MLNKKIKQQNFNKIALVNLKEGTDNLNCRGTKGK